MTDYSHLLTRRPILTSPVSFAGKVVLITGAGGSIGSELARVVGYTAERMILVDRCENSLFQIRRDLEMNLCHFDFRRKVVTRLHDVADDVRDVTTDVDIVFHAAAHKHVPMMEDNADQACKNNVIATANVANASRCHLVRRFIQISTDKAVHPTSVMGMTKRLAERYIETMDHGATRFGIVRFGNVIGSSCSVVAIWEDQVRRGLPITVTDPRMMRYFMTVHEAASLVCRAAMLPQDCEEVPIYCLDMGEPVNIVDLARRFVAGRDIPIVVTGMRPGEKLTEVLAHEYETLERTEAPGIFRLRSGVEPCSTKQPSSNGYDASTPRPELTATSA